MASVVKAEPFHEAAAAAAAVSSTACSAAPKAESTESASSPGKKRKRTAPHVKLDAPEGWLEVYEAIEEMRRAGGAPVDVMGCEMLADAKVEPRVARFQTLVSLMLSSQTKDQVTAAAVRNLQLKLPGGLTIESVLAADVATLDALISKVGFHNRKCQYLKATALQLQNNFNSDIPDTVEGLCSLPGVGPKMAHLTMQVAWGKTVGIGVDVHVHRISNRLGWVKTKDEEGTRRALEEWLPESKWRPINKLFVGFGQTICRPVGPLCEDCAVADRCPSAGKAAKKSKALSREDDDYS
eukprot:Amastigsp_a846472_19.p2 type:complete len:296 gc:universal Amastigsp_a846472_19:1046-159(-)